MRAAAISFIVYLTWTFGALAQDCDCGHNPYVNYELSSGEHADNSEGGELEFYGNPWEVVSVEHFDTDLTQADEPEVCVVHLRLIPRTDSILYSEFQVVPENDYELHFNGKWILASEFENQMDESGCQIEGAQS